MVRFAEISVMEHIGKVGALIRENYAEMVTDKDLMQLAPDLARYEHMERHGVIRAVAAFEGEEVVAYSAIVLYPHLHFADLVIAMNDTLFVSKAHRGSIGVRLIRETEALAKKYGAKVLVLNAKVKTALAELLPRMGYGEREVAFVKEL